MKKKRWICIMLCSMMLFGTVACGKDTEPLTPAPSEKVTLMFEVDEGLGRAELTTDRRWTRLYTTFATVLPR